VTEPRTAIEKIWAESGHDAAALKQLDLAGAEPALPSSFRVGTAVQASIALSALAANEIWRARTGRQQRVGVDMHAAAVAARSEWYVSVDGVELPERWDKIAGTYQCGDGRYVRLHTNFPHHRDGVLSILRCDYDRDSVAKALQNWSAFKLEDATAEAGLAVTAMRSFDEWDAHPQGQAVAGLPLLSIERIGDAEPPEWPGGSQPLSGLRVLDLTRVIAGPVCGRTLAAHGADVLLVTAPHLPSFQTLVVDTGRGKLSSFIDLREASGRDSFVNLLRDADVVVQGYRPGGLAALGFGPDAAARIRPGIVYVSLTAYGSDGPWAPRHGFDSLVQTVSGFNVAEAQAAGIEGPKPLPAQALDHCTGYLMAFAVMTALLRRSREGGSWYVRASLAQIARWLRSLGRIDGLECKDPTRDDVRDLLEESDSAFGRLTAVRHAATMSETPPRWERPSVPLGTHPPVWPN
jgi:crotonobetainyl-CoA:carnitine CoA-transferase CaiB-like acyl-CoA transferase